MTPKMLRLVLLISELPFQRALGKFSAEIHSCLEGLDFKTDVRRWCTGQRFDADQLRASFGELANTCRSGFSRILDHYCLRQFSRDAHQSPEFVYVEILKHHNIRACADRITQLGFVRDLYAHFVQVTQFLFRAFNRRGDTAKYRDVIRCHNHARSEEHTSELQSLAYLVCRLLLEKKKN